MTQDLTVHRWEWRTFAPTLSDLEARIGVAAKVAPRASDEVYFLGSQSQLNLKARKGTLDLKILDQTDADGLQLWKPAGKVDLPAPAESVVNLIAPFALNLTLVGQVTLDAFSSALSSSGALRPVEVKKSRRSFNYGGCLAEFVEVTANGQTRQSFCIESENREALLPALRDLGLSAKANVSFPDGLKRDFGIDIGMFAPSTVGKVEIERKFLVDTKAWKPCVEGLSFRQGYLSSDKQRIVRVRVAGKKGYLTIKGITVANMRSEFEYEIPVDDASQMLENICERPIIEKTRYNETHGGKIWEIDVFHGDNDGLVVAEVELSSASETFEMPQWAGREVSGIPRYFNNNLIAHPYKNWPPSDKWRATCASVHQ